MKSIPSKLSILVLISLLIPFRLAAAQEDSESLSLRVRKDFGFGLGHRIQGSFTLSATGPSDLHSVDFIMDDMVVFQDDQSPFEFQLHTSDYETGIHKLSATGITDRGTTVLSDEFQYEFISVEEGWAAAVDIFIPLFIIIVAITTIGISATSLVGRRKGFRLGEYSHAGGAVCSRCSMPFSRHLLSLNLVFGKLERCPHCGKWGLIRRATSAELAEAEARFKNESQRGRIEPKDERANLKRLIEESRYEND
jgi:hypothetical protein